MSIRRRYIKLLRIARERERALALVADADGHAWSGLTLFRSRDGRLANVRHGLRIFKRPD